MVVLVGESGSGKSTIEKELVEKFHFKKIVKYTTRDPRYGEKDGVDYHFVTEEKFEKLKKKNFFAEYAKYNDWSYGTPKDECLNNRIIVLTPRGLRKLKGNTDLHIISFYINVPRRDRLIKLLERGDNIEEAYRRSLSDVGQYDGIKDDVDYVINNAGYKKSINEIVEEILFLLD